MQISKALFTFVIVFVAIISGTVGYLVNVLVVNQERAELNEEVLRLEQEVDRLELQLEAERTEEDEVEEL